MIALLLAAVGLYALTAHGIAQRRKEIGVRMTLGAPPRHVRSIFIRQTARIVWFGIVIGVVAAISLNRLLAAFVSGANPRDPVTLAVVTVVLVVVAMIATVGPLRRATRVDPIVALRND